MFLRLYFLLPNEELTQKVISELLEMGVKHKNIHAIVRQDSSSSSLPKANKWQRMDISHLIEDFAWTANLIVFCLALIGLILFLIYDMNLAAILSIAVMAASFILGDIFALLVPKVHLDEFEHALNHGEVLLMIDSLKKHSAEIETRVIKHHPAAIAGGSCWTIQALGI